MNRTLKKIRTLYFAVVAILIVTEVTSCKDYGSDYTDVQLEGETQFNGTILEFLEQDTRFDSMMVVVNGIPGLRDSLQDASADLTLFAVPNECFKEAISRLNNYREVKQKGENIYLEDLMIEPFTVIETQPGPTPGSPPVIIEHPYDYRLQLDSLISRYIFRGRLNSEFLEDYINGLHGRDFKYNYAMHMQFERQNASGIEGMGRRRLIFSDENNTQLAVRWDRSETQTIDIKTKNGYVHILNEGHEFSFSKLISQFQNYGNEYIYD